VLFGLFEQPSGPLFLLTAPEILWEASLAPYLTFKGFRPSPSEGPSPLAACSLSAAGLLVAGPPEPSPPCGWGGAAMSHGKGPALS
jgi:hypothetical protein